MSRIIQLLLPLSLVAACSPGISYIPYQEVIPKPLSIEQTGYWTSQAITMYLHASGEGIVCWEQAASSIESMKFYDGGVAMQSGFATQPIEWDGKNWYVSSFNQRFDYIKDSELSLASMYCEEKLPAAVSRLLNRIGS